MNGCCILHTRVIPKIVASRVDPPWISEKDLGNMLARSCSNGINFAMVRSYYDRHVSKKNLTKKPKIARYFYYELLDIDKEAASAKH